MPPFDIEVRFFARATGLRLAFNPDSLTDGLTWEETESGGLGQCSIPLAQRFDAAAPVQSGDTVEVWILGETIPRYRGKVSQIDATLDARETRGIVAYGRMEDMNHVLLDRVELEPGGADLSLFAAGILADYEKRRGGTFERDIQPVGQSSERLEMAPATARAALDALTALAPGNVVWGWDISPTNGKDRFYLRPRVSKIGSQFFVGDNVRLLHSPEETQGIVNAVLLQGGTAKFPNLVTNGGFEQPALPAELNGNLIINPGFEYGAGSETDDPDAAAYIWTLLNGATRNTPPHTVGNHAPHTGGWYLVLDHPNEEAWQEVTVNPAKPYRASVFCAQQTGASAAAGRLIVEGRSSAGTVLETYTLPLSPPSTSWVGGQGSTVAAGDALELVVTWVSASVAKARVRLVNDTGSSPAGLIVDDVTFADASAVGQTGWQTFVQNPSGTTNKVVSVGWASRAAAWEGAYGVRLKAQVDGSTTFSASTGPNGFPELDQYPGQNRGTQGYHFAPLPSQALRAVARVRRSPGLNTTAGEAYISYNEWAGDGHGTQYAATKIAIPNDGAWYLLSQLASAHTDAATGMVTVGFTVGGWYDVDGVECRDQAATAGVSDSVLLDPQTAGFLRGDRFERYVTAEQVCPAGSDAANSVSVYGRQEAVLDNPDIVIWNGAAASVLAAYFARNAVSLKRPRLDLTHEPTRRPGPADGRQVQISGLATADVILWPARAAWSWSKGALATSVELTSERPTLAKLLRRGVTASSGGGSARAVGGAGGGATTPAQAAIAVTDGTTTVAGAQTVKVIGGSVAAGADPTEADITIAGTSPATAAAFGTVETDITEAGGSVVYTKTTLDALLRAAKTPVWGVAYKSEDVLGSAGIALGSFAPDWLMPVGSLDGDFRSDDAEGIRNVLNGGIRAVVGTELHVDAATTITIAVSADNAARVHLNGVAVGAVISQQTGQQRTLNLVAGWNKLQVTFTSDAAGARTTDFLDIVGVGGALSTLVNGMRPLLPAAAPPASTGKCVYTFVMAGGVTPAGAGPFGTHVRVPGNAANAATTYTYELTGYVDTTPSGSTSVDLEKGADFGGSGGFGSATSLASLTFGSTAPKTSFTSSGTVSTDNFLRLNAAAPGGAANYSIVLVLREQ